MGTIIFFLLLIISGGFFISEVYQRYTYTKLGRPEHRSDRSRERWKYFFTHVLLQKKTRDYPFFGLFHGLIVWGFLVLLLSSFNMAIAGLFHARIPLIENNLGYLFIRDTFIALVIAGVFGLIFRRIFRKPGWLHNSPIAFAILILILVIVASELLFYAVQMAVGESGGNLGAAWVVSAVSSLLGSLDQNMLHTLMKIFWWVHFLATFSFFFIIPYSKHLHLIFAPLNTYWHSLEPKGSLQPIQLNEEKGQIYGVNKLEDFTWKQLFDALSCAKCGRCSEHCPAQQSGELINPKKINGRLRKYIELRARLYFKYRVRQTATAGKPGAETPRKNILDTMLMTESDRVLMAKKMVGDIFEEEFIWNCTTCGGCVEACPVSIEHTAKIIDMRRCIVSGEGDISPELKQVFNGIESRGNPWGIERNPNIGYAWARELGIPTLSEKPNAGYLYFLGCAASYDESARNAAVAFARILISAGVDFAILGEVEWCCGETARRLGNELLFQQTAKRNISSWHKLGIKKILTICSHCFNTLQNEYPQFGGDYMVIPHSAFLANLVHEGKLKPAKRLNQIVTFHDSCYLGRYNGFYNEQREIIKAIPGVSLVEMPRTRENSFCCGAGGGRFWMGTKTGNSVSMNRAAEALVSGADVVCTACPYCLLVLKEEIQRSDLKKEIITMDIAELLESSL